MKKIYYLFVVFAAAISGCELDNYEPPQSPLTGRIVFEGNAVGIRQGISVLQLFQPGFQTVTPINVNVKQDGTFASMLFDGNYKLVRISGNGPWEANTDTIDVVVKGATSVDVPVRPYFTLSDASFSVEGEVLNATCRITNVVAGRQIERISLILGKTIILDDPTKLGPSPADPLSTKAGAGLDLSQPVSLSQNLTAEPLASAPYLYARIALKVVGVPELLYSDVYPVKK
ncbi:DUF3823 domain-containing protein [Pedobacter deserti]|uniref:DUF3823 domain-containing protein n=1 Tax=Pedobacter deserti TaxID=2817382 RepID=UPI00210E1AAC|nr:DUF3823 domain-containing protein [Pedobacter sp. SYSU D00382]